MYKRTPTTPTSDYARWLAEEDTDLTGPPGSSSKPKFAPADPSPEPTLKLPTTSKADGSVLEQVVEVMKEKQLLEATLARMEASMEARLARPTTRYIDEEPEVDHALVCLSNEDPTHLRLGDDEEYSSDSD